MTDLEKLKLLTMETGEAAGADGCASSSPRAFEDGELILLLELHEGDVRATAYDVLLKKAVSTKVTLAGMTTAEQEKYWLRLAARMRPNRGGAIDRADQP